MCTHPQREEDQFTENTQDHHFTVSAHQLEQGFKK